MTADDLDTAPRHVPMRRCVGCGRSFPKGELLHIVKSADGAVRTDPDGRLPGRGAHICRNMSCLERARKRGSIPRSLRLQGSVPDQVWHELELTIEPDAHGRGV